MIAKRDFGYDLIRTFAILCIFLYHILNRQASDPVVLITINSLAVVSLSLLGFISAALLSNNKNIDFGTFLVKRLTRIYLPLILCLTVILILHAWIGKTQIGQQVLLHFMGLTAFFKLLGVENNTSIGYGLWFITAIIGMYLFLPVLQRLFAHRNGLLHLIGIIILCTGLDLIMWGTENIWTVVMAFSLGVYLNSSSGFERFMQKGSAYFLIPSALILLLVAVTFALDLPHAMMHLFGALSPLVLIPLFFSFANGLPNLITLSCGVFAGMSYEFYILHFYFVNEGFKEFFPMEVGMFGHIVISFLVVFILAYLLSLISSKLRDKTLRYFLND